MAEVTEVLAVIESGAGGFCAGIVLWDDKVIEAAPVVRYMKGWTRDRVRDYCKRKKWFVSVINQTPRRKP